MNQEKINQIEERLTKLEELIPKSTSGYSQVVGRIKQPSYTITSSNPDFGNLTSVNLESTNNQFYSVRKQLIEILENRVLEGWEKYITVDRTGEICNFENPPHITAFKWNNDDGRFMLLHKRIPMEDVDWKQCCWKISDLLITDSRKPNIEFVPQSLSEQYKYKMKNFYDVMESALLLLADNEWDENQKQTAINMLRTYIQKSKDALTNL